MSKGKKVEDLPLCDLKNECELVKTWKDEFDEIHKEPFCLFSENLLAMEIYERITQLSTRQQMQWMKGKKRMEANVSTLDKIDFVMKYYLPEGYNKNETITLIDSVVYIYNLRLKYHLS